ncbi:MAG: alpha/beta fold hydrolase [Alkalispirochaeta sp.]
MNMENVEISGMFWRRFPGAARPLVILHGLFGSGDNWQSLGGELASEREVLIPDLPNHGRSVHVGALTFPELTRIMWESLEELEYGHEGAPVVLLGHSMGGKVAMAMAFDRPEAVSRLIVADIAPKPYPPRHNDIFEAMERVAREKPTSRSAAEEIMAGYIPQKGVRLFLLKSLVRSSEDDTFRWQLDLAGLREGYSDILGWPYSDERYNGPAAVISGGNSPYVTTDDSAVIHKFLPRAALEVIPNAGHWLHSEERDRFLELVRSHID